MPPIGASMLPKVAANPSLTFTVPQLSRPATRRPRAGSEVQTLAFRPYSESLARATASASSRDRVDADHRTEGLVGVAVHLRGDAGEHGRLVERAHRDRAGAARR